MKILCNKQKEGRAVILLYLLLRSHLSIGGDFNALAVLHMLDVTSGTELDDATDDGLCGDMVERDLVALDRIFDH